MSDRFDCYFVEKVDGAVRHAVAGLRIGDLPEGDVLIRVSWSSLNYKDAMAARGHAGVVRQFPHIPGVDIVGTVVESSSPAFRAGERVLACAYEIGSGRWGGWSEYARIPAAWVMSLSSGLTPRTSMCIGTAGFTAALCLEALQHHGVHPGDGEILVTGASGGVGSTAVMLLGKLGYRVVAASGKTALRAKLRDWGAAEVVSRESLLDSSRKPLLSGRWAGAVDTVGGEVLGTVIRQTRHSGCVAACGVAGGAQLPLTVYPFILRGVTLAGIDAAFYPMERRKRIWANLAGPWSLDRLEQLVQEANLRTLDPHIDAMLAGNVAGRIIIKIRGDETAG
jgi:putative YhdH/YhfP family quinone oxidoreductase